MDGGRFPFAIYRSAIFTLDARASSTSAGAGVHATNAARCVANDETANKPKR